MVVLAIVGWAFLPSLGDDVTTYHGQIALDLETAGSARDLLRPQSGLVGLAVIYGALDPIVGRGVTA
jgi:hypothetical protein